VEVCWVVGKGRKKEMGEQWKGTIFISRESGGGPVHLFGELASACIILKGCIALVAHIFQNLNVPLDVGDTNLRPWFVFGPGEAIYSRLYDWIWDDSFLALEETVCCLRIAQDWQNHY